MSDAELATVDGENPEVEDNPELRRKINDLRKTMEENSWELAFAMNEVHETGVYQAWGYKTWKDYVEVELDFAIRKAQYLIGIAQWFGQLNAGVRDWVKKLGWTKAKELTGRVTNENSAEWKKKVEGQSVSQIQKMLKESADDGGDEGGDSSSSSSGDDKEKAKKKNFKLFGDQMENVNAALEKASELSGSDKEGHNLDMICVEFLGANAASEDVGAYLKKVESVTGIKLIGYDPKKKAVVYGEGTLDELAFDPDEGEEEATE